jgi:hypothetical protein
VSAAKSAFPARKDKKPSTSKCVKNGSFNNLPKTFTKDRVIRNQLKIKRLLRNLPQLKQFLPLRQRFQHPPPLKDITILSARIENAATIVAIAEIAHPEQVIALMVIVLLEREIVLKVIAHHVQIVPPEIVRLEREIVRKVIVRPELGIVLKVIAHHVQIAPPAIVHLEREIVHMVIVRLERETVLKVIAHRVRIAPPVIVRLEREIVHKVIAHRVRIAPPVIVRPELEHRQLHHHR